ncbi:MAG: R3H domain-containing nucleic acid-binding protein [Gloeobacterales cyanobacterium]
MVNASGINSLSEATEDNTREENPLIVQETRVTDDLAKLLAILPPQITKALEEGSPQEDLRDLIEIILDLGRLPEARFVGRTQYLSDQVLTQEELDFVIERVGEFSGDNRAGIGRTLHRISAIRNRQNKIIGLTCRVGRAVYGTLAMIRDLVESGKSILMLGRPGVGKTTALREMARVLADDLDKRVVVIDTSNEIAGDGDVPHPAIGRARRMQVARPELQHQVMIEAVENHMPEVIIIDEIGTELEAQAARTIAERGVMLVGTAHGNQLENLIKNPTLSDLVGGIQSVTLGDDEARRRGTQKSVLERKAPPTFDIAIEMSERTRWMVHEDCARSVDSLLRGQKPNPQVRTVTSSGQVEVTREVPEVDTTERMFAPGWSVARTPAPPRVAPFNAGASRKAGQNWKEQGFMEALPPQALDPQAFASAETTVIYPYGVSRNELERVIRAYNYNVRLTKELDEADVVMALRSHVRDKAKICTVAQNRQIPVYAIKANTLSHVMRGLRRILHIDEPAGGDDLDLNMMLAGGDSEDHMEALEEARLAVEQLVLPRGQSVELLPRSPKIRRMQHELVEHYQLTSESFGEEPHRRLRIYPPVAN